MEALQIRGTHGEDAAPITRLHILVTVLCGLVALLDGFDTQSIAFVAPVIAGAWHRSSASFGPVFGAGLMGLTLGAFILSPVADRFGRKTIILLAMTIFGGFAAATALASSMNELLVYRLLTGFGLGAAMPNIIALTSEYAPLRLRATLVTIMFCGFPLGSTLGGLISTPLIAAFGWPAIFILGGVLPLLLLPFVAIWLPESARFLAAKGDVRRVSENSERVGGVPAAVLEEPASGMPVLQLFRAGRARVTCLLWLAFFMNLLVMYFLVNWLPSLLRASGQPLEIAILSTSLLNLGGVAGAIVLGRVLDRLSPPLVLGTAYLGAALFIGVAALGASILPVLLPAVFLAGFGVVGAQIGMNAMTAGIYPTAIRATGVGWALGVGRIGAIIGPVAGGLLLADGWTAEPLVLAAVAPALVAAAAVFGLAGIAKRTFVPSLGAQAV